LFAEGLFQGFIGGHPIVNTAHSNEVLFSIGASSPAEVDAMATKAIEAGGSLYGPPAYKDGWMYGCGFCDLDGHRWNILYMDMSKMPQ
jgi:predicted lactoylglutathione lyase